MTRFLAWSNTYSNNTCSALWKASIAHVTVCLGTDEPPGDDLAPPPSRGSPFPFPGMASVRDGGGLFGGTRGLNGRGPIKMSVPFTFEDAALFKRSPLLGVRSQGALVHCSPHLSSPATRLRGDVSSLMAMLQCLNRTSLRDGTHTQ